MAPKTQASLIADSLDRHLEKWAVALYLATMVLCAALGARMAFPWSDWQFVEPCLLRDRLFETIIHLHAQPPLMNLWAGVALKLEALSGVNVLHWLLAFHLLIGASAAWAAARLTRIYCRIRTVRLAAGGLIVFHPLLYAMSFVYFYPLHETLALTLIPIAMGAYVARPNARRLAALCAAVAFLALTRALFHFLWGFATLALAMGAAHGWRRGQKPGRRHWAIILACTLLLLAWPVKNKIMFGVFNSSSWQGLNFSHALCWEEQFPDLAGFYGIEHRDGIKVYWACERSSLAVEGEGEPLLVQYLAELPGLSPGNPLTVSIDVDGEEAARCTVTQNGVHGDQIDAARFPPGEHIVTIRTSRTWLAPEGRALGVGVLPMQWETPGGARPANAHYPQTLRVGVPKRYWDVPVLTRTARVSREWANLNHYGIIADSRRRMSFALNMLRRNPQLMLKKMGMQYWCFTRSPLRQPYDGSRALGFVPLAPRLERWAQSWDAILYQDFRGREALHLNDETASRPLALSCGYKITLPALLLLTALSLALRRGGRVRWSIEAAMFFSFLWLFAMAVVIDGCESNRMRASLDFTFILLWAGRLESLIRWRRNRP